MYREEPISVTNPSHYRSHPSGIECIEIIRGLPFSQGNAIKYLWRAGDKGGPEKLKEDLNKALWYIKDTEANGIGVLCLGESVDAWAEAEKPGHRKEAISSIFSNNHHKAIAIIDEWIEELG